MNQLNRQQASSPLYPYTSSRSFPVEHFVAWPALGITLLVVVYTLSSSFLDYRNVIVFGCAALLISLGSAVVCAFLRSAPLVVVSLLSFGLAFLVAVRGVMVMQQVHAVIGDLGSLLS